MTLQPPGNPTVSNIMRPLSDAASWMRLIGTMGIIYGVLIGLSIIGLLFAWLRSGWVCSCAGLPTMRTPHSQPGMRASLCPPCEA